MKNTLRHLALFLLLGLLSLHATTPTEQNNNAFLSLTAGNLSLSGNTIGTTSGGITLTGSGDLTLSPSGGNIRTNCSYLIQSGNIQYGGHLSNTGSAPTIAAGTGAGTSPTIAIAGTDQGCKVTLTTGTAPTLSATVFTVTFAGGFSPAPFISFAPGNSATALLSGVTMCYVTPGTSSFTLTAGTTALTSATQYVWYFTILQ